MRLFRRGGRPRLPRTYHFAIGHCRVEQSNEEREEELSEVQALFNRMFENSS